MLNRQTWSGNTSLTKKFFSTYFVIWGATGHKFQVPFVFHNLVHSTGLKKNEWKNKVNFFKAFDNPLWKYLNFKYTKQRNFNFARPTSILVWFLMKTIMLSQDEYVDEWELN